MNGAERRDAGHESALSHFAAETVVVVIEEQARQRETFTSDDVLEALPPVTRESLARAPNALGACIRAAAKAGKIEPTGRYVTSRRPEAHARKIAEWRRPSSFDVHDPKAQALVAGAEPRR